MRTLRQNIKESLFRGAKEKPWESTEKVFGEDSSDPIKVIHVEKGKFIILYKTNDSVYNTYLESSNIPALKRFAAIHNTNNIIIIGNLLNFDAYNTIFDGCGLNFYINCTIHFDEKIKAIKNINLTYLDSSFKYFNDYVNFISDSDLISVIQINVKYENNINIVIRCSMFRPLVENTTINNYNEVSFWFNRRNNVYLPIFKNSKINVKKIGINGNNLFTKIRKNTNLDKIKEMFKKIGYDLCPINCKEISIEYDRKIVFPKDLV